MIAESSSRRSTFAAESDWPFKPRSAWICGRKLVRDPCSASSDMAHARSATFTSRRARTRPRAPIAAMNCVPLMSDSPSFADRTDRLEPGSRERGGAVEELAVEPRAPLADEREREVGERREIPARTDRAARGDIREHAAVEALDEQLDGLHARARAAFCERVRAQQHRRAHDLSRVRLPDAARVASEQPKLELVRELLRDRAADEAAEARVDPVRVLACAVGRLLDERPSSGDALAGERRTAPRRRRRRRRARRARRRGRRP